jgi:hypothetical protein
MTRDGLRQLDKETLIDIILRQQEMIERQARTIEQLEARVTELEAKLNQPPKTPRNSSKPPSQGQKRNRPAGKAARKGKGGKGTARALHPNPDRVVEARAGTCPDCGHGLDQAGQRLKAVYDRIEIPPVSPDVTTSLPVGARRWSRTSSATTFRRSGCRIASQPNGGTVPSGRSAWPTCCATCSTPWMPATRCLLRRSRGFSWMAQGDNGIAGHGVSLPCW